MGMNRRQNPVAFGRGRTWAVAGLLALLGCAPTTDEDARLAGVGTARAAPEPRPVPGFTDASFVTADGQELPLRQWLPRGETAAVILALHGFNDYSNAFAGAAEAWAHQGIATYAYDQRGFGAAPERGLWPGRAALAADAAAATLILRRHHPLVPLYLLGESMGGAVAVIAATGESGTQSPEIDGLILIAPAVWGRTAMPLLPRLALWAGVRLLPALTLSGRGLQIKPSDNAPMLRALARDPLVIHKTRIDTIYGLVDLMDAALASAPVLDGALMVMYGAKDEIIPKAPIRRFVSALPAERRRRALAWYEDGYHMLLRDLEGPLVIADVASWALWPAAPLPSGADHYAAEEFSRTAGQVSLGAF
jgi:alpha-beta hydrolase superfamily lysophospholipase